MNTILKIFVLILMPLVSIAQQDTIYLNSLRQSLSNATSDTVRMEVYSRLASYYTLEDRDSSSFYLEKARSLAVGLKLKFDEASILNTMGILMMQQEKFSKSLEFYLSALNIARDPAIEKSIRHISKHQRADSVRMILLSETYDLIGLLNAYTGNWSVNTKNQLKNYREAEKYAVAAGDSRQLAYVNFHMGIAYMNEDKLDSAVLLMERAISTFTALNDQSGLGRAFKFLGDTYEKKGQYELAATMLRQSVSQLMQTNDQLHLGLAYMSLSRLFTNTNRNDSALYFARESLKIFEKRKDPAWKRDAYNLITASYERLGQTDSSVAYLKLSKSLSDSLGMEERKNLLGFLDVVVDEQAKLERLEKEKIETRNKIRSYSFIGSIIVLSLIGLILYRNNKKEKRAKAILEKTLDELKSTQAQLIQSEKMASLGELTAGIAHEIQNPLNFVNNFSEVSMELTDEVEVKRQEAAENSPLISELLSEIKENLVRINHHGKRADDIVKGMLLHSPIRKGRKEPTDISTLITDNLQLAYQNQQSKDPGFEANIKTSFDPAISTVSIVPGDIAKVLVNCFNNAFYACAERRRKDGTAPLPQISVTTKKSNKGVEITVTDNGTGIDPRIMDKIFQPFFTTKPTGHGTGLGLSIAYDIITAHGGELKMKSGKYEGAEFLITLNGHA